jgi:hypothetical protein
MSVLKCKGKPMHVIKCYTQEEYGRCNLEDKVVLRKGVLLGYRIVVN